MRLKNQVAELTMGSNAKELVHAGCFCGFRIIFDVLSGRTLCWKLAFM